jgi:hypothetical protein
VRQGHEAGGDCFVAGVNMVRGWCETGVRLL